MTVRCTQCFTQFDIPKVSPGDHRWVSRVIAQANSKHKEMKPECQNPKLIVQLDPSGPPLVPE